MKTILTIPVALLALLPLQAFAAYVEADVEAGVTQCGFYLDTSTAASISTVTAGKCRYNVSTVTVGAHTVTADARKPDPIWGTAISPKSAPFAFTKPGPVGNAPSNFVLVP